MEQEKYNVFLYNILQLNLFKSGSELIKMLVNEFGVSETYARKILSRSLNAKVITSSKPYTFGKGQFIYLFKGQELDVKRIKEICENARPPIYRLLEFMDNNGGVISYYEAMKITASPEKMSSTKVQSLNDILKILRKLKIVYEKTDERSVRFILYKSKDGSLMSNSIEKKLIDDHYAKMIMDCSLIPDIIRWLNKSNLIDNLKIIYRNKNTPAIGALHNNLVWDAFSYTKSTGINTINGVKADKIEKQTLVVMDIVISGEYSQVHLDGFYNRIQINKNSVTSGERKILPIIIYRDCEPIILNKISKLGFIAFDIGSVFGTKIYFIIKKLKEVNELLNSGNNTDQIVKNILKEIRNSGQEDALKDLKGVLFECLMYPVLKNIFSNAAIERNKTLITMKNGEKEYYEYDYIINSSNPSEIIFVELKGYDASATISLGDETKKSSLKWFFCKTLPFAKTHFTKEISEGKQIKALYITSGKFWDDGRDYIKKINNGKYKSSQVNVAYERNTLIELLKLRGFKNEINIIDRFYKKEDLA